MIRYKKSKSEIVKMFLYLWILFCLLIILSIFITLNWGEFILSFFITYDFEVSNIYLSYIVIIAVAISFVGSSQGLYQGINKSVFLLGMIFVSAIVGLIYFFNDLPSFISLLEVFLISIFTLVMMVLAHLLFVLVYKTYGSRD